VQRQLARWAPWLAGALLVAGIASFALTRHSGGSSIPPHRRTPLVAAERRVALEFIATAVARKDLTEAWDISAPELKQGMSLDEWNTGTIPVVPYPAADARPALRVVNSFTDTARIQVTFVPRPGTAAQPATFNLELRSSGGHWLVSSWLPSATVTPPAGKGK
jgi:hypothetical protein